jgi:hypothetical protein
VRSNPATLFRLPVKVAGADDEDMVKSLKSILNDRCNVGPEGLTGQDKHRSMLLEQWPMLKSGVANRKRLWQMQQ